MNRPTSLALNLWTVLTAQTIVAVATSLQRDDLVLAVWHVCGWTLGAAFMLWHARGPK